jgi:hypothetical protein
MSARSACASMALREALTPISVIAASASGGAFARRFPRKHPAAHRLHSSLATMSRLRSILAVLLSSMLTACPQPEAEAKADVTGNDDGIVVQAKGDGSELEWGAGFDITGPEIGEWLAFVSPNPPTNLGGIARFDPNRDCTTATIDCELPGVGYYASLAKVTEKGAPLRIIVGGLGRTKNQYFVLARRGGAPPAFVTAKVLVGVTGGGGCFGMPDPPTVSALEVPRQ